MHIWSHLAACSHVVDIFNTLRKGHVDSSGGFVRGSVLFWEDRDWRHRVGAIACKKCMVTVFRVLEVLFSCILEGFNFQPRQGTGQGVSMTLNAASRLRSLRRAAPRG